MPPQDRAALEENRTVEMLKELQAEGKVRFIGMSGSLPNLPDHLSMNVFDAFQIPYSAVQRDHENLITEAADKGTGTLIRGGAARSAASQEKNWTVGPLAQQPGVGQRNWETSGIEDLINQAGIDKQEFILRFTLSHPGLSTTIVGTANPAHLAGKSPSRKRARYRPTSTRKPRSASRWGNPCRCERVGAARGHGPVPFAAVEQLRHPELRPVVVGGDGDPTKRGVGRCRPRLTRHGYVVVALVPLLLERGYTSPARPPGPLASAAPDRLSAAPYTPRSPAAPQPRPAPRFSSHSAH
ncbi:aldo/keto reductase [Streptomyces scabiei]|uniref:aldo/keto reductase n=1 Tax=Streptomyces scabiei TaxID=1930 RepID=UPI0033DA546B